jgi:hypothetical protein
MQKKIITMVFKKNTYFLTKIGENSSKLWPLEALSLSYKQDCFLGTVMTKLFDNGPVPLVSKN